MVLVQRVPPVHTFVTYVFAYCTYLDNILTLDAFFLTSRPLAAKTVKEKSNHDLFFLRNQ
jgi:hypothetical protein